MTHKFLKTALIASGAALLIAAGPKADLNQDGQVTKAEFTDSAQSRFYETDTNFDGFISQDERKARRLAMRDAMRETRKNKRLEKLDTNSDGTVSADETNAAEEKRKARIAARRAKALEKHDTDNDGQLSEAERAVMKAEQKAKRAARQETRKEKQSATQDAVKDKRKRDRATRRADRPKLDADGDGRISLDEHMAVTEQLFLRMDANGDGVLTRGEGRNRNKKWRR